MKTFAVNLHFIAVTIERFVATPRQPWYIVSIFCMVCKMAERKYSCVLFTAKCLFIQGIFVHLSILFIFESSTLLGRWSVSGWRWLLENDSLSFRL